MAGGSFAGSVPWTTADLQFAAPDTVVQSLAGGQAGAAPPGAGDRGGEAANEVAMIWPRAGAQARVRCVEPRRGEVAPGGSVRGAGAAAWRQQSIKM